MKNFGCFLSALEEVRKVNENRANKTYEIVGFIGNEKDVEDLSNLSKYMVLINNGHLYFGFEDFYYEIFKVMRRGEKLFIKTVFNKNPIVIMVNLQSEEKAKVVKEDIIRYINLELSMYNMISEVDGGTIYD